MKLMLILPIFLPLMTALPALFFRQRVRAQKFISLIGAVLYFVNALFLIQTVSQQGILVHRMGNWPPPYGIPLVADPLAALMILLTGIIAVIVAIFAIKDISTEQYKLGFSPLLHFLLMGVSGAFLSGDVFNLYVWFEVLLISSFILLVLGGSREQIQGALKYVTINLIASVFFLCGAAILYGKVGTLNMADLAFKLQTDHSELINSSAMLFLIAFSIKSAAFPFFFWLPDSYHTPSYSASALFSGLLTKVGIYAMLRMFVMIYPDDTTLNIILIMAGFTMVIGVFGAIAQMEIRRLLSFHIISQIGYSMMGIALATRASIAAAIFFTFHVAIAKAALFLVAGVIGHRFNTTQLKKLGGLYKTMPSLSIFFLLPALALAGLPPLSGFVAKFALIKSALAVHSYGIVITALAVSILTMYSMIKIWSYAFWAPSHIALEENRTLLFDGLPVTFWLPLLLTAIVVILLGIFAQPILNLCNMAADVLVHPESYIHAVLRSSL